MVAGGSLNVRFATGNCHRESGRAVRSCESVFAGRRPVDIETVLRTQTSVGSVVPDGAFFVGIINRNVVCIRIDGTGGKAAVEGNTFTLTDTKIIT